MPWKPDYVDADTLALYMRITGDQDDAELALAATASSRAIDGFTHRQFGQLAAPEQRFYTAWIDYERGQWVIDVDDFMTTVGMVVEVADVGTLALTDFTKEPVNAAGEGRPWERLVVDVDSAVMPTGKANEIAATVRWGWTAIPNEVKLASKLQGSRFHSRRDSPYGVAGSPDTGSEMRLLSRVDPDVGVMLRAAGLVRQQAGA